MKDVTLIISGFLHFLAALLEGVANVNVTVSGMGQ